MALDAASIRKSRSRIPALKSQVYVNWGGSGPSPTTVLREVDRFLKRESRMGPFHPQVRDESKATLAALRASVAKLFKARTGTSPKQEAMTWASPESPATVPRA